MERSAIFVDALTIVVQIAPPKNQLATHVERLATFLAFVGARVLRFPRKFRPDKLTHYHPTVQTPCVRPMQRRVLVAWPRP